MEVESKIFQLISENEIVGLKKIIVSAGNLEFENSSGLTPLMFAAKLGNLEAVEVLLENGANPQSKDKKGKTAYNYSLTQKNSAVSSLLRPVTSSEDILRQSADLDDAFRTLFGSASGKWLSDAITSPSSLKSPAKKGVKPEPLEKNLPDAALPQEVPAKKDTLKLEDFVGQEEAKSSLRNIISVARVSITREKKGLPSLSLNFHAVFQGNPGTGKTTFARFYAQEVNKLGLLSKGHLTEVSRQDLVAEYQGQTATKTSSVIEKAKGGVLFIDEAYALKNSKDDNYGQEAIDTLVKAIEDNRSDLIVILAGYTQEMRAFLHLNPGLKSRIPNVIEFSDFTDDELTVIFHKMMEKQKMNIEEKALELVKEQLGLGRKGKSFGNAREVRNIFERALSQQSNRLARSNLENLSVEELSHLIYSDLTPDPEDLGTFEEIAGMEKGAHTAIQKLMRLRGLSEVKQEIRHLADYIRVTKARRGGGSLKDLTAHMIFIGNPGTGKTTVARLMGEICKEIGLLGSGHLVEVDRAGLVAGFQGQTAIKTKEVIESAIGGVLFIDEAYSLARGNSQDSYGQEAVDTLLKCMEDLRGQLVVVLAGYAEEMQLFLASNTGLKSRFSKIFYFEDFSDQELQEIADDMVKEQGFELDEAARKKLLAILKSKRSNESNFANARSLRQTLEQSYKLHAARVSKLGNPESLPKSVLNLLAEVDFEGLQT